MLRIQARHTAELFVVTLREVFFKMLFNSSVLAGGFLRDPIVKVLS